MSRSKRASSPSGKACCMISEILEESGIDRESVRRVRRQLLEGIIMLCRWQLERMDTTAPPAPQPERKGRRVTIE